MFEGEVHLQEILSDMRIGREIHKSEDCRMNGVEEVEMLQFLQFNTL